MKSKSLKTIVALSALSLSTGCIGLIVNAAKKNTVNMEKWDVKKMDVDIRSDAKEICPRQSVQMAVYADVKHKKRDKEKQLETWYGDPQRANRIGKMGFEHFDFAAKGGTVDQDGYFLPNPDMIASAIDGFEVTTSYKKDPKKFTSTKAYKPTYSCITGAGTPGALGPMGNPGPAGSRGSAGAGGNSGKAGGSGALGGAGGPGSNGMAGSPGPNIVAYATIITTPHHSNLVALKITGDVEDVVFFDPSQPFVLSAAGGAGGPGGPGGAGGAGGPGGSGNPGGNGGQGGPGGPGGIGGQGGPGGTIQLVYDPAFPELANAFQLDASGGAAGEAGMGGSGGNGGSRGAAVGEGAAAGAAGADGTPGTQGSVGAPGPDGQAQAIAGDVEEAFAFLPEQIERPKPS